MAKRAFSLVELLFVVALTGIVMGVTVSLYGYTMTRLAAGTARFTTENQARSLVDEIEIVVRDSVTVTVVSSGGNTGLRCTLAGTSKRTTASAGTGTESRNSKTADPVSTTKRGYDKHTLGKRVWFYMAGPTGNFGTAGTYVWRAERNDDTVPTSADISPNWASFYGNSARRFPLIVSLNFAVDTTNFVATITAVSRQLWRDERTGTGAEKESQLFTETRSVGWRHWFK
jgi:prepilin-type N-terminal cleavage/methylation domain-containing protein